MFCYILRAAKGEHGGGGKSVVIRWLHATYATCVTCATCVACAALQPGLFLLQCLGRVGAGGAEGLPEDGQEGDGE